jgi:serine/threonine-protein kinase
MDSSPTQPDASRPYGLRREPFAIGAVVGGVYELRSVLGEGGMGRVFEAWDRGLHRKVALKAPWRDVDPGTLLAEARAIAAIRHPSMLTVHALGEDGGLPYVVMERLYGVSLEEHMRRRAAVGEHFAIEEATHLLAAIAEGLLAVHGAGVAHRDVKPENVMLCPGNRVVLMDFGIVLPQIAVDEVRGTTSGTPEYMAPESISSEIEVGAAHLVDVYALGVLAYELLVGDVPFRGEHVVDVLRAHLDKPVPDAAAARPEIPARLAELVRAMLAKDPRDRPQGMEEVLADLRRVRVSAEREATARAQTSQFSVLVVDDDKEIAKLLGIIARKAVPDAEVRLAHDGEAALTEISRRAPDVLILDLHMPRMNGIEVAMYARGAESMRRCAILSVSAGAQPEDVELLRSLGVSQFIPKGAELNKRVGGVLKELRGRR